MSLIDVENSKRIRNAMTVICGMDVPEDVGEFSVNADLSGSYDTGGELKTFPERGVYMDLSGDGFINNGLAKPLPANHTGILSKVYPSGLPYELNVYVLLANPVNKATNINIFCWDDMGLHRDTQTITKGSDSKTIKITGVNGRIEVVKISFGESWWFDNSNLISCDVNLRSVETKVADPELQISDIEITGYMKDDVINQLANVGENYPIYYSCGYSGDMSPVRKFYLSGGIELSDHQITIHGEDATKFLENEYGGLFVGNLNGTGGGIGRYIDVAHKILEGANIEHRYVNDYSDDFYLDGEPFLIEQISKRKIIAQMVNYLSFAFKSAKENYGCFFDYVDAGIPTITAGKPKVAKLDIKDISDLKITTDRYIKKISINTPIADPEESYTDIETVSIKGSTVRSVSDPCYAFSVSAGTVSMINPYTYGLKANGSATVRGRKISIYDPSDNLIYSPFIVESKTGGVEEVVLDDMCGGIFTAQAEDGNIYATESILYQMLTALINRSVLVYEFTYRGDPRLQPRDYINVLIDDVYKPMTIESITLNHQDGGLTSTIVARGGFI